MHANVCVCASSCKNVEPSQGTFKIDRYITEEVLSLFNIQRTNSFKSLLFILFESFLKHFIEACPVTEKISHTVFRTHTALLPEDTLHSVANQ